MKANRTKAEKRRITSSLLAAGSLLLAIPTAGFALGGLHQSDSVESDAAQYSLFTPALTDPALAKRVNERLGLLGQSMPFTPAGRAAVTDRTVTVAVRVDGNTARAITVRAAIRSASGDVGKRHPVKINPTRYDLGIARGYQSFTKPVAVAPPPGLQRLEMPDLAEFRPSQPDHQGKPSRLQPRISLEQGKVAGRAPRTLETLGEQSVDVGGAYSITRNLDVTAGVRLSQERNRQAPLTDSVQDNQAVYVGTQFRF
ncbi:MAG: hypothetical protein ACK5NN_06060 [Sphingomonadaceae bacterium]